MQVWKLRTGGIPPLIVRSELDIESARLLREAQSLVPEINVLLKVAAKSNDYYTKKARLEAGVFKLGLLKLIALRDDRLVITSLEQVEASISLIRAELDVMSKETPGAFEARSIDSPIASEDTDHAQRVILNLVSSLERIIDESLKIAVSSKVRKTKISRLEVAKNNVLELADIARRYPDICDFDISEYENAVRHIEKIVNDGRK